MGSFQAELVYQSKVLERGVYGLPEAVTNIQSLKSKITLLNEDRAGTLLTNLHCYARNMHMHIVRKIYSIATLPDTQPAHCQPHGQQMLHAECMQYMHMLC